MAHVEHHSAPPKPKRAPRLPRANAPASPLEATPSSSQYKQLLPTDKSREVKGQTSNTDPLIGRPGGLSLPRSPESQADRGCSDLGVAVLPSSPDHSDDPSVINVKASGREPPIDLAEGPAIVVSATTQHKTFSNVAVQLNDDIVPLTSPETTPLARGSPLGSCVSPIPVKIPLSDPSQITTTKITINSPRPQPRTRLPVVTSSPNTSVFLTCPSDVKLQAAVEGTAPSVLGQSGLTLDAQEIKGQTMFVGATALGEAVGDDVLADLHPMRRTFNIPADHDRVDVISPARSEDDFDLRSDPSAVSCSRQEPLRHPNTSQKGKNWNLDIIKPVVILGDSNLSRIPSFTDERVQIDSFPGAGIHHLHVLLKKLSPALQVREVILSIGLNNCLRKLLPTTSDKQLSLLMAQAKQTFPNARIRIPVISYSDRLDGDKRYRIHLLNRTIVNKYNFLTEVNKACFKVNEKDQIHWLPETARCILNHWLDQLNF